MLNDPKHSFGHGYCLAATLLNSKLINLLAPEVNKLPIL